MIRGRVGAALLAPAAVAALALSQLGSPGGTALAPAPALGADCVPVQHSKRVVKSKKVRRKGKVVKVKRKRVVRWTTCEPPAPVPCTEPAANLGVIARDDSGVAFTLSRPCVTAGAVSIELNNQGEDPHTLALRPASAPASAPPVYRLPGPAPDELAPGLQASDSLELSAGDWYLWCDLLDHEAAGMNAMLRVR